MAVVAGGGTVRRVRSLGEGLTAAAGSLPPSSSSSAAAFGAFGTTEGGGSGAPQLVAVLPSGEGTPLGAMPAVVEAQEAAAAARGAPVRPDGAAAVYVMRDRDLGGAEVVELVGVATQLVLPVRTTLPTLVLHIKDVTKFLDVELSLMTLPSAAAWTASRRPAAARVPQLRHLLLSNRVSAIRVGVESATLPLSLSPSWNHLALALPHLVTAAFGEAYESCTGIVLHATTRVAHVYFQDRPFADCELPPFLRTLHA